MEEIFQRLDNISDGEIRTDRRENTQENRIPTHADILVDDLML